MANKTHPKPASQGVSLERTRRTTPLNLGLGGQGFLRLPGSSLGGFSAVLMLVWFLNGEWMFGEAHACCLEHGPPFTVAPGG